MKTVIFGLRAYPFRLDVDAELTDEAQKMSHDFIYEGIKYRNK